MDMITAAPRGVLSLFLCPVECALCIYVSTLCNVHCTTEAAAMVEGKVKLVEW